jgi:hypothetical protein
MPENKALLVTPICPMGHQLGHPCRAFGLSGAARRLGDGMASISIRVADADLQELDRRASLAGMSRTAFVLKAALDRATEDELRLADIEDRLSRVEDALFGR